MLGAATACVERGIRMIDTRHEQAAAMMAHAYARVRVTPGVCMACSGPGTINLSSGLANALVDCAPVIALGGSSPLSQLESGAFQEFDQVAVMKPVTKWSVRVHEARRIPEYIDRAFRRAMAGKPGPVYLDLPGDVLYHEVKRDSVVWTRRRGAERSIARPAADASAVPAVGETPNSDFRQRHPVVGRRRCLGRIYPGHGHTALHHTTGTRGATGR